MEKEIERIWNENPKIPFMQSKDILQLGYTYGYNVGCKQNNITENIEQKPNEDKKESLDLTSLISLTSDINTTNATNQIKKKRRKVYGEPDNRSVEGQIKLNTLNFVRNIMDKDRDFLTVYMKINAEIDNIRNSYGI